MTITIYCGARGLQRALQGGKSSYARQCIVWQSAIQNDGADQYQPVIVKEVGQCSWTESHDIPVKPHI
jgi:hypothetical protein